MTAEIAIMNKSGVALAADSAVTISGSDMIEKKVYNSANKLFALSKVHPVGIMIFNNAQFMGTPWETIIKLFRKTVSVDGFDYLIEYADSFFKFLNNFDMKAQKEFYVQRYVINLLIALDDAKNTINKNEGSESVLTDLEIVQASIQHIDQEHDIENLEANVLDSIDKYKKLYGEQIWSYLLQDKDEDDNIQIIREEIFEFLVKWSVILVLKGDESTGVVFSGFGNKEVFPTTVEYTVKVSLFDGVEKVEKNNQKITLDNDSAILPFAQSAEVNNFMRGVGTKIDHYLGGALEELMVDMFPNVLADLLSDQGLINGGKEQAKTAISSVSNGAYKHVIESLAKISVTEYTNPVIGAVSHLSVKDLAIMAETFINLESFRKRVTFTSETVGGPIDVAVITKSEGLIWIKRKHYFSPELNSSFFKKID